MKTIEARDLRKTYLSGALSVHAVKGVTVSVEAGQLILLMGPSGSGKTTLLSMLGCILRPTGGTLRLMGREVDWDESKLPRVRRNWIGFVFQHFNLLESLAAWENVEVTLRLKGVPDARARAVEALRQVGLGERVHFLPRDLSGGEKQRVAVARALAPDPAVIIADEPTGNLDSATGLKVMELMKSLAHDRGKSVIMATHDPRWVPLADRIWEMVDGELHEK